MHLNQFLRLKSAEAMLEGSAQQGVTSRLRAELASGTAAEIAGYTLHPELALGIDAAEFALTRSYSERIAWLECSQAIPPSVLPGSAKLIDALARSGQTVTARAVNGPNFWQTVEIEEAPGLTVASLDWLRTKPAVTWSASA
jgi:hypothetical protein